MIVKLNNTDITNKISLEHGYVAKDNFTPDNFDSITYTFYFKEEIEIKVSDILEVDNRQWLIGSIDGSIAMKKPVKYKITILCIELTKILERFIVPPCAFTNKNLWLQTQMLRAIDKAVLRRNDETRKFVFKNPFSNTEANLLYEVDGEDFFFNEMTTLREVLDEMLSIVKHRIEIIEIRDGIITLGARSLIATPEIKTLSNSGLVSKRIIQSYENYAKNYETMVDNVYPANKNIINDAYNLSWENWQTLKPITPEILSTNNAKMVVTFPIEQLLQVKMQWKIVAELAEKDQYGTVTYTDVEYSVEKDITDLFLEEEIYNALPLDEQEKHFSYSKGEKAIGILKTRKVALYFPISEIENQMFLDATVQNLLESQGYTADQSSPDYPKYRITENYPTGNDILTKTLYWIFYKSYQNYHISISKDGDYDFKGGTVIQNPEATQIDLQRYGNFLEDTAKNKGNKEIHYDYIIKDTSDLLLLGDRVLYDENSIMTLLEREYAIFNNFVKAHYVFAINYAAPINARLNRERRAFINPIKNFIKRDIFIKDKVMLITTKYADDRGLIKRSLLNYAFANTLDHTETTTEPLDLGVIYTPYGNYQLQMHGSPVGNSIRYHFECLDNYSAGLSIGDATVGGYAVNLNPYVNSIGELEDIEIDLIRSVLGAASQELTFQQKLDKALAAPLTTRESSAYSNKVKFKIWKDTFEHLTFTYQLEFSAFSSGTVIIGNLAKYIELVNGNKLNGNAYIWVSDEKYYNTENKRCKGIKTAYQPEKDIDKDIINPIPTAELITYNAWAIGTSSGELLVAVNNLKTDKHLLSLQIAPDTINI